MLEDWVVAPEHFFAYRELLDLAAWTRVVARNFPDAHILPSIAALDSAVRGRVAALESNDGREALCMEEWRSLIKPVRAAFDARRKEVPLPSTCRTQTCRVWALLHIISVGPLARAGFEAADGAEVERQLLRAAEKVDAATDANARASGLTVMQQIVDREGKRAHDEATIGRLNNMAEWLRGEGTQPTAAEDGNAFVFDALTAFLRRYFTCRNCRSHFLAQVEAGEYELAAARAADAPPRLLALWWWRLHSAVSARVAAEGSCVADRRWPSEDVCGACYEGNQSSEAVVESELLNRYWPAELREEAASVEDDDRDDGEDVDDLDDLEGGGDYGE